MSKLPLNKSIEATKLNERTEAPLVGPPVTIPFGALIEPSGTRGDREMFRYLGELYSAAQDMFLSATRSEEGEPDLASTPAVLASPGAAPPANRNDKRAKLVFEKLDAGSYALARAKVTGGWLVAGGTGVAFYPDPAHEWDGTSLE